MPLTVTIKPAGLTVACTRGTSLLEVIRRAGIPLLSSCGGNGTCGRNDDDMLHSPGGERSDRRPCRACGGAVSPSARFCGACGAKVMVERVCENCGMKSRPNDKFCRKCGASLV